MASSWRDRLETLFGTSCPYKILGVSEDCEESEIKKGYRRQSLLYHPDRVPDPEKASATEKFQALSAVHEAISDPERRKIYDESKVLFDEDASKVENWSEYWRIFYKKVTTKDIQDFLEDFRGSEEEAEQVKESYISGKGSMDYILSNVLGCEASDETRFHKMISEWVQEGSLPEMKAFQSESESSKKARARKAKNEAKRAEKAAKELGLGDGDQDLARMIMKRQTLREAQSANFLDNLAAKYSEPTKKKKKKK